MDPRVTPDREILLANDSLTNLSRFSGWVAHEINNPLASIQNAFALLQPLIPATHPHYRFVGAIEREIARVAALTQRLHQTYSYDEMRSAAMPLAICFADAFRSLESLRSAREVTFELVIEPTAETQVVSGRPWLASVRHLMQHAIEAAPPGRTIPVRAWRETGLLWVAVADHEPVTPVPRRTAAGPPGLALAFVTRLVFLLGGELVRTPYHNGVGEIRIGVAMPAMEEPGMTILGTILIADDDDAFLASTAELLRQKGYEVHTAPDADGAMAAVRSGSYDLLVSDLEMPGNEGLRLVRDVAAEAGGLPVIILTGLPTTESAVASIDLPVAAYLLKPVDMAELLRRIEIAIARFRAYRTMRDTEQRMEKWRQDLGQIATAGPAPGRQGAPSVDAFLALTLRNVMGSLSDLGLLGQALSGQQVEAHPCQLMNCPRGAQLQAAVQETIAVLEQTKGSFKSKQLGDLRQQLELLLKHV